MTTSSENDTAVKTVQESLLNETDNEQKDNSLNNNEDKNNINDDTTTRTVNSEEQKENTINHNEDDHRSKKPFNSKVKYSSTTYQRSPYYTNGHPYGASPYYYYHVAPMNEKPTPLMVIPTQPSLASSSTTTTTTTADNQTGNSTAVSPSNLPPRLRQTSTTENDSTNPPALTSQVSTTSTTSTTTNTRRHRSILPRGSCNYYSLYPPPPLMATPPGVLYPYQPGHIAYNIRTPDELDILTFQQQFMNLPGVPAGPLIWPPPPTAAVPYPQYPPYPMYGPTPYMYNNPSTMNSNNSFLNPNAAEWVPTQTDSNSSSDTNLLIDDEINFPPLNTNRTEELNTDQAKSSDDSSPDTTESVDNNDTTTATNNHQQETPSAPASIPSKAELTNTEETKNSSSKLTTISYSTIILQAPDRTKSMAQNSQQNQQQKTQVPTKQRTQVRVTKDNQTRKRQPQLNRMNYNGIKNALPIETPKQQIQQSNDDWIQVKSKKTKKFDRSYDHSQNSLEKAFSDDQNIAQSSLPSTAENTTTTCTSDDDEILENKRIMIVENKTITTTTDYNQVIVDDIHQRLNNNEKLLIIMRGCPGSGKSTLARSLNDGYNGQIISIDEYLFDAQKLEEAHLNNRRLVSEAFKRNISPVIIDSTNTTSWEMKPYVAMGKEAGYDILLIEPQTPWRYKPRELVKRNPHNLPLRRIKEILNRFEHNITVQSLIDQLKTNFFLPCQQQSQQILDQNQTDTESIDPILTSKKSFDNIDESSILDDVRLCIDDMLLFLTSTFYQTSLSIPFTDLSFVTSSSSPTSPSTPHSLFHRSLSRFSSSSTTTASQDHSFSNEHLRRMQTASYSRCFENFTPPTSTKRRKNKTKQQTSNDILLNTNNNNNNYDDDQVSNENTSLISYEIYLPEDSSNYIVIDEHDLPFENNSSINPQQQKQSTNQNSQLLNIIHDGLIPTTNNREIASQRKHIGTQCSTRDLSNDINDTDRILFGRVSDALKLQSPPISPPIGYIERGIQVDLNESTIDSLANLIEFYSNRLSEDLVRQFYENCNGDIQYACTQIDEYLQHNRTNSTSIPTLRQLSLNTLNQWNEQIKCSNPSFDTVSIADLLEDINNEEIFEDYIHENQSNQLFIPSTMIHSLEDLYGELPNSSTFDRGLSLPLDDELSLNIYQALQRFLGVETPKQTKVNNEKKSTKKKPTKQQNQQRTQSQWISPVQNQANVSSGPSLKQIMDEEINILSKQKTNPKRQLDFASQHKFKQLESQFPSISSDVLHDIFCENEYDFDLTYVCISSMLDENLTITSIPKSHNTMPMTSFPSTNSKQTIEYNINSHENSRIRAQEYALKRKEYYNKADQANRHGMTGVASYYINQAREQSRLMKEANRAACEQIYRIRLNEFRQTNRLDLHELHMDEALELFQRVEQDLSDGIRRTTLKSIEIITGYGKNSPYGGGTGKIRSTIISYLRQRNYKYSEPNKGAILVQL